MTDTGRRFLGRRMVHSAQLKSGLFLLFLQALLGGELLLTLAKGLTGATWQQFVWFLVFVVFVIGMYFMSQHYTSKRSREFQYTTFSLMLSLVFLPTDYFFSGGLQGDAPILYLFGFFATALLLDYYLMGLALTLMGISFGVVITAGALKPSLFPDTGTASWLLIPVTMLFVGLAIGEALHMIYRNYRESQKMLEELMHQMEENTVLDPLTHTHDRGYLQTYLEEQIQNVSDGKLTTFSILLFDLDYFKTINDLYGHLAGDDCIRKLVELLRENLRKDDVIARYGGEEFVCVLPGADETGAVRRAEQIRKVVEDANLTPIIDIGITVSGGVAGYRPGQTPRDLIRHADRNLYLAKQRGRNRIVWQNGRPAPEQTNEPETDGQNRRSTDQPT